MQTDYVAKAYDRFKGKTYQEFNQMAGQSRTMLRSEQQTYLQQSQQKTEARTEKDINKQRHEEWAHWRDEHMCSVGSHTGRQATGTHESQADGKRCSCGV